MNNQDYDIRLEQLRDMYDTLQDKIDSLGGGPSTRKRQRLEAAARRAEAQVRDICAMGS
jgi:hypothetical protein